MNKILKVGGFKLLMIFAFIVVDIFVSALGSRFRLNDNAVNGIAALLFFLILLFLIIAPAFKKRERTFFYDDY